MRYCPVCDEEYLDSVERCTEDGTPLLDRAAWEAERARQGRTPIVKALVAVASFDDRFEADELAQALADEGFEVALVTSKPQTLGTLTDPGPAAWSIVVPESDLARAQPLVAEWREALESSRAEAEQAAESEAVGEGSPDK